MNRIRKYGNKWQVLITPYQQYNTSFEILKGFWTDEHIHDYYIEDYDTLNDAQGKAFTMPDIEWINLVLMYKDVYHDLRKQIKNIIDKNGFVADFYSTYMDPEMAKNAMFDRVLNNGNRFSLVDDMNDIISYQIVNPWTTNINEIANVLIKHKNLRIFKKYVNHGIIHLVGKTDIGTTYEIGLWTTLLSNWMKWSKQHPNVNNDVKINALNDVIKTQKYIDSTYTLR